MTTKTLRALVPFILIFGALYSGSRSERAAAQKTFRVIAVELKADDGKPTGKCPLTVKFNGNITAEGAGTVTYKFTRSDGGAGPAFTITFDGSGTKPVSNEWTLGDASALPRYEGWMAISTVSPNVMESSHETGSFVLNCAGAPSQGQKPSGKESSKTQTAEIDPIIEREIKLNAQKFAKRNAQFAEVARRNEDRFSAAFAKAGVDQKQLGAELQKATKEAEKASDPEAARKIIQEFGAKRIPLFEKMISNLDLSAIGGELNVCKSDAPGQGDVLTTIVDSRSAVAFSCMPRTPKDEPTPTPTPTPHTGVYDEWDIYGPFPRVRSYHQWEFGGEGGDPRNRPVVEESAEGMAGGDFWMESHSIHTAASLNQWQEFRVPIDTRGPARRIEVLPVYLIDGRSYIHHHSVTIPPGHSTIGIRTYAGIWLNNPRRTATGELAYTLGDRAQYYDDIYNSFALIGDWDITVRNYMDSQTLILTTEGVSAEELGSLGILMRLNMNTTAIGFATMDGSVRAHLDHIHVTALR